MKYDETTFEPIGLSENPALEVIEQKRKEVLNHARNLRHQADLLEHQAEKLRNNATFCDQEASQLLTAIDKLKQ